MRACWMNSIWLPNDLYMLDEHMFTWAYRMTCIWFLNGFRKNLWFEPWINLKQSTSSVLFANRFKQFHGCKEHAPWPPVSINMNLQHKSHYDVWLQNEYAFQRQLASNAPAMNTYANKNALKCWLPSQHCIGCRMDLQLNLGVRVVSPINTFPPKTTITQSLIQELWFPESSTVLQNEFQ